jgi:hypothetical protein
MIAELKVMKNNLAIAGRCKQVERLTKNSSGEKN